MKTIPLAFVMALAAGAAMAQDSAPPLEFEAASVKLHTAASPSTGRSGIEETKGLIRIENLPLKMVIQTAYGVKDFQLVGPPWMGSVFLDITAKPPADYRHEQLQPLLRNLLAGRFQLAVHHESKEVSGFALVAVKGGTKLEESTGPRGYFTARPGLISGTQVSMTELIGVVSRMLGRPVVDDTALAAAYDVKVEWTPEPPESSEPELSLSTALREQLGLRLQTRKVMVDMVVVDRVEKAPIEN